jgi:hypothetical protein
MNDTTLATKSLSQTLNPLLVPVSKYLVVPVVSAYLAWSIAFYTGITPLMGFSTGYGHYKMMFGLDHIDLRVPVELVVFYASTGDEVVVDYKINDGGHGSLFFNLPKLSSAFFTSSDFHHTNGKRQGTVRLKVTSSGLYRLAISPTPTVKNSKKSGYDLTWSASWKLARH